MGTAEIIAFSMLLVFILWVLQQRSRKAVKAERAAMFDDCLSLFTSYRVIQDAVYWPILEGRYKGYEFKLEPIADDIAFRTLPPLLLLVTVRAAIPYEGVFDFLARPKDNVQFYSPSSSLRTVLRIPDGWPRHATLRTNDRWKMPPMKVLDPHMAMFDDSKTKELFVNRVGVRVVYEVNRAIISYYKVLRQVKFENLSLSPELVKDLMERTIAVAEDLIKENPEVDQKSKKEGVR